MANGHQPHILGTSKDPAVDRMIAEAQAQQQAQNMLAAILQQTMRAPAVMKRAPSTLIEIAADPDGNQVLLAALPNGERWEILLSTQAQRMIARRLAEIEHGAISLGESADVDGPADG